MNGPGITRASHDRTLWPEPKKTGKRAPGRQHHNEALMNLRASLWLHPLQFLHRPQHPTPNRVAVQVALIEHGIRPHGGLDWGVLAVVLYEEVGRAEVAVPRGLFEIILRLIDDLRRRPARA